MRVLTCGAGSGWQFAIRTVPCEVWRQPSAGVTVVLLHGPAVLLCVFAGRSYYLRRSIYRQWSGAGAGLNHHQLLWHRRENLNLMHLSDVKQNIVNVLVFQKSCQCSNSSDCPSQIFQCICSDVKNVDKLIELRFNTNLGIQLFCEERLDTMSLLT